RIGVSGNRWETYPWAGVSGTQRDSSCGVWPSTAPTQLSGHRDSLGHGEDTHSRRLADAQQQVASREVGDLWTLDSRQLPGTLTAAGSSRGLAISSRGPHGGRLLQGPSDQKAGALTAVGFSRGLA
ncbi:unnamed protein product, partial [Staurois parvus]